MNAPMGKPSVVALALTIPLLFFGILMSLTGLSQVSEWQSETATLTAFGLGLFLAGFTTVAAALWIVVSLGRKALPLRIAALAIVTSGALMITGVLSHVMECTGPA